MQCVDQRRLLPVIVRQSEAFVATTFGEVPRPVFGFLFLDHSVHAGTESERPVQLDMLGIGKNDCFASVNLASLVDKTPEDVESAGGVNSADLASQLSEELFHHPVEDSPFDLSQEFLGWHLLSVCILHLLVLGECS